MATLIASLLLLSKEIIFIDPYFNPSKRQYKQSFKAFFQLIESRDIEDLPKRIEIHTKDQLSADYLKDQCIRLIPNGLQTTIKIWRQRTNGEALHNRYILTDIGGVIFPHGLDEGEPGENDDITLLDKEQYELHWSQYASNAPAFDLASAPIEITG